MENLKKLKIYTISSCLHLSWQMQSEYSIYGQNVQCYVKQKTRPRFFLILYLHGLTGISLNLVMKALYQTTGETIHSMAGFVKDHDLTAGQMTGYKSRFYNQLIQRLFFFSFFFFLFRNCNIHKIIEIRRQGVKLVMRMHENIFGTHLDIYRMTQLLSL